MRSGAWTPFFFGEHAMERNRNVESDEIQKIRSLDDSDLIMLISEIHDHGWSAGRTTLWLMPPNPNEEKFRECQKKHCRQFKEEDMAPVYARWIDQILQHFTGDRLITLLSELANHAGYTLTPEDLQ
jgi:hypothetical protein